MDENIIRKLSENEINTSHPSEKYFVDILTNKIISCRAMKLASIRHFDDKMRAKEDINFNYHINYNLVELVIKLVEMFKIDVDTNVKLMDWQKAFLMSLFGWVDDDGKRRFRESFLQVARKNGKSALMAMIGLMHLLIDDEKKAEIYCIATKQEQARIVLRDMAGFISRDDNLSALFKLYKNLGETSKILSNYNGGKALALGQNSKTLDGLRTSFLCVDELHEHKDEKLVNVVENGMRNRKQPHTCKITTAGLSTVGYGYSQYEYYTNILEKRVENDKALIFIFELDSGDDWKDEKNYCKSNPSLNILITMSDLIASKEKAITLKSYQNEFRSKLLNQWLNGRGEFISNEEWTNGQIPFDDSELLGRECFGGVDLAKTRDLTSVSLAFPFDDGNIRIKTWSFVPEQTARDVKLSGGVDYEKMGVILTAGNVIDDDYILTMVREASIKYDIKMIAYDRWLSKNFGIFLYEQSINGYEFGQGFKSMSPATKDFEVLTLNNKLHTNNDKVLEWCVANMVLDDDPAGNIKPSKSKSINKIDTAIATIMAIACKNYWDEM